MEEKKYNVFVGCEVFKWAVPESQLESVKKSAEKFARSFQRRHKLLSPPIVIVSTEIL